MYVLSDVMPAPPKPPPVIEEINVWFTPVPSIFARPIVPGLLLVQYTYRRAASALSAGCEATDGVIELGVDETQPASKTSEVESTYRNISIASYRSVASNEGHRWTETRFFARCV